MKRRNWAGRFNRGPRHRWPQIVVAAGCRVEQRLGVWQTRVRGSVRRDGTRGVEEQAGDCNLRCRRTPLFLCKYLQLNAVMPDGTIEAGPVDC